MEKQSKLLKNFVVSTRIRLARNISSIPFTPKLSATDERIFTELFSGVKKTTDELGGYDFYLLDNLDEIEKQALFAKHIISKELLLKKEPAAVVTNSDGEMSIMLCEEDHIRAQAIKDGFDLSGAYTRVDEFDEKLSHNLPISFDSSLGYLTSCPTNLGTGMRASVMMFLPALTASGKMGELIQAIAKLGMTTRGVYGEGSVADGCMYQISNQNSYGLSELEIIEKVGTAVTKICSLEESERTKHYKANAFEIKDRIMRSFGILSNAYLLPYKEFLSLITQVKLGVYYGLIDIEMSKLDSLLSMSQNASLCKLTKKRLDDRGCQIARATYIKTKLKE